LPAEEHHRRADLRARCVLRAPHRSGDPVLAVPRLRDRVRHQGPMFPLHTWLPDAHVEAPTAGSVILAAILLKMGTYGFLRFAMPLFPQASVQLMPWIAALAIFGIWYGALVAMVQPDLKKLVAY